LFIVIIAMGIALDKVIDASIMQFTLRVSADQRSLEINSTCGQAAR